MNTTGALNERQREFLAEHIMLRALLGGDDLPDVSILHTGLSIWTIPVEAKPGQRRGLEFTFFSNNHIKLEGSFTELPFQRRSIVEAIDYINAQNLDIVAIIMANTTNTFDIEAYGVLKNSENEQQAASEIADLIRKHIPFTSGAEVEFILKRNRFVYRMHGVLEQLGA